MTRTFVGRFLGALVASNAIIVNAEPHAVDEPQAVDSKINFTWDTTCSSKADMAKITDMKFSGDTLGQEIAITGKGEFLQPATQGTTYTIIVYAMGIPLLSQTHDFCEVRMKGLPCPVSKGAFTLAESLTLSPHMVFKKASVRLTAQDANKKQYFCVNLNGVIGDAQPENAADTFPLVARNVMEESLKNDVKLSPVPFFFPEPIAAELTKQYWGSSKGANIDFTWNNRCTKSDAMAKVTDMKFIGNELGKTIRITGSGEFLQSATQGTTFTMVVSAMGVPLLSHTDDYCNSHQVTLPMGMGITFMGTRAFMGQVNIKGLGCPTGKGAFSLDESLTLSPHIVFPRASVTISAQDANKKQFFCVTMNGAISAEPEQKQDLIYA